MTLDKILLEILDYQKTGHDKFKENKAAAQKIHDNEEKLHQSLVNWKLEQERRAATAVLSDFQNWWKTQQQGPSSEIINQESLDQFRSVETLGKDVISNIGVRLGEDKEKQLESLDDVKQMIKVLDGHDSTVTEILSKYGVNNVLTQPQNNV